MEIKLTKIGKSKVKLHIKEDAKEVKKYFDMAYTKLAPSVTIKGFRPGKAPRMMTINQIGIARYNNEALNLALPMIYSTAVKKEKLTPVGQPKISIISFAEEKPMEFEAEVDLLPEVKLGDYKKIKVSHKMPKVEVKKEEVQKVIDRLLHQSAKYTVKSESAKIGDRMEISFEGKVKGVLKDKYTSKHYPFILGEKVLLPEFEKHLTGAKKGDKKDFSIDIKQPDGKKEKVDFSVEVHEVWNVELPKIDDEFVKKFGHKTEKDLRDAIEKSIGAEKNQRERQILEEKVLDEVLKKVKMDIPEGLVDQEVERRIGQIKQQTGPAYPKYLENLGKDESKLRTEIRPAAERAVRISLALAEISKDLDIFDPKKLGKDMQKNQMIQQKALKDTMDKLVDIALK